REAAMRQAPHAGGLVFTDHRSLFRADKYDRIVRRLERVRETRCDPSPGPLAILGRHPEVLALDSNVELHRVLARLNTRIRHLPLATRLEAASKGVAHCGTVGTRRAEAVKEDVAVPQFAQLVLPALWDRAFLGE